MRFEPFTVNNPLREFTDRELIDELKHRKFLVARPENVHYLNISTVVTHEETARIPQDYLQTAIKSRMCEELAHALYEKIPLTLPEVYYGGVRYTQTICYVEKPQTIEGDKKDQQPREGR